MTQKTPYVGRPMKRVEDPRLVRGIATYVDDLRLAGTLHAAFVRSPYAHARITRIRTDAAKAAPGVAGVFVAADVNQACGVVPCSADMPNLKHPSHRVLAYVRRASSGLLLA